MYDCKNSKSEFHKTIIIIIITVEFVCLIQKLSLCYCSIKSAFMKIFTEYIPSQSVYLQPLYEKNTFKVSPYKIG